MSATVAAALKKAAVYILGDEKKRGKLVTVVLSAAVGLLLLLCAPAVMLSSLGEVGEEAQVPELHINADDISALLTVKAGKGSMISDQQVMTLQTLWTKRVSRFRP